MDTERINAFVEEMLSEYADRPTVHIFSAYLWLKVREPPLKAFGHITREFSARGYRVTQSFTPAFGSCLVITRPR